MNQPTRAPIAGLWTVGVPVTDQDRALDFYVDKLGFERRLDVPFRHRWALGRSGPAGRDDHDRPHLCARGSAERC